MIEQLPTLISGYGFPIAMCVLLFWKSVTSEQKLINAVDNNTIVLKLIKEKIN